MWNFEELNKPQTITYKIKGVLSEECKKQIESMGIADKLGIDLKQPISIWNIMLLLLAFPVSGIAIGFSVK